MVGLVGTAAVLTHSRPAAAPAPVFHGAVIEPAQAVPNLPLLNNEGKYVHLTDFPGKLVVLYFGYTNCPDECPTTLLTLAEVRKDLGDHGQQVQVLLVTVDPERDTLERLGAFVQHFDPAFGGLTGTREVLRQLFQSFSVVTEQAAQPPRTEAYFVGHTSVTYVLDQQGRLRLAYPPTATPDEIAADLRLLLQASSGG
jgi:protein SCO1/2